MAQLTLKTFEVTADNCSLPESTGGNHQLKVNRMMMNHTNQTEEDLFSCYSPSVVAYRYFVVLWGCAVTITGSVGNLMTILAFAFDPHLRARFNVLIINLAVADLLSCTILQPISVDSYLHLRWRSGQLWCRIYSLLLYLSNSVSIVTLCLIAVSRYLLVVKRAVFDRVFSDLGLILLLISAWTLSLASCSPLWPFYKFVPQLCTCSVLQAWDHPYTIFLLFFYFFFSLCCISVFYLLIYRHVRISSQALLRYRFSGQGADATTASPPDIITSPTSPIPAPTNEASSSHSSASGDNKEMKRLTHMCLTVFLCFVICYVPFMLLNIADKHERAPQVLHMFCANLTGLSSCINPVLYAAMNRQFRQAYRVLITRAAAPFSCLWTWWSTRRT